MRRRRKRPKSKPDGPAPRKRRRSGRCQRPSHPDVAHGNILKRLKLPKQVVPVVFNPVFRDLVAFKSADDYHGPLRFATLWGNSLPFLTLRGIPSPPPHAFVTYAEEVIQSVGSVGKGVEEVGHRLSPGFPPVQAPVTKPMRDEIVSHIFV